MTVVCAKCGKRFNASDAMLGKRVRCRGCGEVFTVTSPSESLSSKTAVGTGAPIKDEAAPPPPAQSAAARRLQAMPPAYDEVPPPIPPVPSTRPVVGTNEPMAPIREPDDGEEEHNPDAGAMAAIAAIGDARFNAPLMYPGAPVVDRFLPHALVLLSLGWIAGESIRSNELGPMWVTMLRVGIFWVLYTVLIWPLVCIGSSRAGQRARIEPPPGHRWRVFATFAFPTALGYILFSIVGGLGSFITGTIVGLAIGLAAYYLLYRLRPEEGPKVIPVVAAYYVAALVPAILALMALNFSLQTFLTASRTAHEFGTSPMGRYLAWSPPTPEPVAPPSLLAPIIPNPYATTNRAVGPTTTAATPTTMLVGTPDNTTGATTLPVEPVEPSLFGTAGSLTGPSSTQPAVASVLPVEPVAPAETPAATAAAPVPSADDAPISPTDGLVGPRRPRVGIFTTEGLDATATVETPTVTAATESPLVESIGAVKEIASFDGAVFPTVPSRHVLVVRETELNEDDVEVWNLAPVAKLGAAHFRRDPGAAANYLLSPDGKTITRIAIFPSLSLQVWSVTESRVTRVINLNKNFGTPTALGFSDNNSVWLLWTSGGKYGIEGWDLAGGGRLRQLDVGNYVPSPNNIAFSPDGKQIAVVKGPRVAGQPQELSVTNIRTGALVRRFPMTSLDPDTIVPPSAIAFSADSTKAAVALESNGQGFLVAWALTSPDGKPLAKHVFPTGFPGDKTVKRFGPHALAWLPGGNEWLLNGTGLVEVTTGRTIGDLGQANVAASRVADGNTLELIATTESRAGHGATGGAGGNVVVVKLKSLPAK